MRVIDNDAQFDAWLKKYSNKNKHKSKHSSGHQSVSKEEFLERTSRAFPRPANASKKALET